MKIGLLSDTHGNLPRTRLAIERLRAAGVGLVIHCGDVGNAAVLVELAAAFGGSGIPVHAVAGNVDGWDPAVLQFPRESGVRMAGRFAELEVDGRRLYVTHGDDERRLSEAIESGRYACVFHGHTHQPRDERVGPTRVINPGALHRAEQPGIAVLDLATDELEWIDLAAG
jgi:uncharacterized protein